MRLGRRAAPGPRHGSTVAAHGPAGGDAAHRQALLRQGGDRPGRMARSPCFSAAARCARRKKSVLRLPTAALAAAVANEWLAQGETLRPETMPLTRLAATAAERIARAATGRRRCRRRLRRERPALLSRRRAGRPRRAAATHLAAAPRMGGGAMGRAAGGRRRSRADRATARGDRGAATRGGSGERPGAGGALLRRAGERLDHRRPRRPGRSDRRRDGLPRRRCSTSSIRRSAGASTPRPNGAAGRSPTTSAPPRLSCRWPGPRGFRRAVSPAPTRSADERSGELKRRRFSSAIEGRVQGVWYRGWAVQEAIRRGLAGWVRNRSDGSVEALFAGPSRPSTR